mmetsp:Transcript_13942/g.24440  ORF Transcript_13942/g.24440 Transcript_13942/m.24440 type:complete len:154 (+) Transcript_13942:47-508(+)
MQKTACQHHRSLQPARAYRSSSLLRCQHKPVASMSDFVRLDAGKRMSEAVVHKAGGVVYLAGQVAEDTTQGTKGQTEQVLKLIDSLLARAGTDKTRILMVQIYMVDIAEFPLMNEAWEAWVPAGSPPARATVAGVALADPGWRLEMVVTAALP